MVQPPKSADTADSADSANSVGNAATSVPTAQTDAGSARVNVNVARGGTAKPAADAPESQGAQETQGNKGNKGTNQTTSTDSGKAPEASPAQSSDIIRAPATTPEDDPLITCVSIIADLLDQPISPQALQAGLPKRGDKMAPELCVRAAERAGFKTSLRARPAISEINPLTAPFILLLEKETACVLIGFEDSQTAKVIFPEVDGEQKVKVDDLQARYTGYTIFMRPAPRLDSRAADIETRDDQDWFWGTLWRFWPIYAHVIIASIVINLFALASPLFIMNVYDRVLPNAAVDTLVVLTIGILFVFAFDFILKILRSYFVDTAGKNADILIASRLLQHVMAMRLDKKPASTGVLANNLREFESLREFFTSGTIVALVDLPFVFLFIFVIYLIGGSLALIPLIAVPVIIGAGYLLQRPLGRVAERTHQEAAQKNALLVEALGGIEAIKTAGAESTIQGRWERYVSAAAQSSVRGRLISTASVTFAQTSIMIVTVAIVVFGVFKYAEGDLTTGAIIASVILVGRALAPLAMIAAMLTRLQNSRVALASLDMLMKVPEERTQGKTYLHRPRLIGQLELQNVQFKYPDQHNYALEGASLRIAPGERVGVLGRIGSGKSTLGRLLVGLYEPEEGNVLIDGLDIRQIDPADVRRNVGYLAQDSYLFFGTVKDNITIGAGRVTDAALARAAYVSGTMEFVRTHPLGFDLPVGERGTTLSGGQRQSVALARALIKDPPILILDEPTSAMDNGAENQFKQRLTQIIGGKTLILISHKMAMLDLVDRIIVFDGGMVMADGPKAEVLEDLKNGRIKRPTPQSGNPKNA